MKPNDRDAFIDIAAYQYFRHIADGDYIMARSAFFMRLAPQFIASAQQALEKYMKCILMLHRIDTKPFSHNIEKLCEKVKNIDNVMICDVTQGFIREICKVKVKYLETSYFLFGHECVLLDRAVWELRRYCIASYAVLSEDQVFLTLDLNDSNVVERLVTRTFPEQNLQLAGGKLEKILNDSDHPARANLVQENAFWGDVRSMTVKGIPWTGENTMLHVVKDKSLYDELCKYVKMPKEEDLFGTVKLNNNVNSQRLEGAKNAERMGMIRQKLLSGTSPSALLEERKKAYSKSI